jgi:hypothetical protein
MVNLTTPLRRMKMELANGKNPFEGMMDRMKVHKTKVNPIHELVDSYFKMIGKEKCETNFYVGRYSYGKLAKEAKELYTVLGENFDDCMWAMDKMNYLAKKNNFDWSIRTCLKHKKL